MPGCGMPARSPPACWRRCETARRARRLGNAVRARGLDLVGHHRHRGHLRPSRRAAGIGAAAMGLGGLLQTLAAARPITRQRAALHAQRRLVLLGGAAVAVYPLAFYTSMRLAGVAVGTVVSIGSAPLAAALAERVIDQHRLTAAGCSAPPSA
jgi:drug/metabolite transporter, DME family